MQQHLSRLLVGIASLAVLGAFAYRIDASTRVPSVAHNVSIPRVGSIHALDAGLRSVASRDRRTMHAAPADPYATVVAEPSIPRPATTPCVLLLSDNVELGTDNDGRFEFVFNPPLSCHGPWAKVVLEADISYDQDSFPDLSAIGLWIGGVNLLFGATPLTQEDVPQPWHVERDITDYAELVRHVHAGHLLLDRAFFGYYSLTSLRATTRLVVYPASPAAPARRKPDLVFPLGSFDPGDTTSLSIGEHHPLYPAQKLASTLMLPRNTERAYLDVLAFGVNDQADWKWWACAPSEDAITFPELMQGNITDCERGSFREVEVSIDNQPAGVAPMRPWIPPLALQPYSRYPIPLLLQPTPPLRALNLLPWRVDLTPFAGVLSDGAPHEVALTIASTSPSVQIEAAATLLVYRDPGTRTITGGIVRNTLAGLSSLPTVLDSLHKTGDHLTGRVATTLDRHFVIDGYILTSHGRIDNRVVQRTLFSNTQDFDITDDATGLDYQEDLHLVSRVSRHGYSTKGGVELRHDFEYASYPLHVFDHRHIDNSGEILADKILIDQGIHQQILQQRPALPDFVSMLHNRYVSSVRSYTNPAGFFDFLWGSTQRYDFRDNRGDCYSAALTTVESALTDSTTGTLCPGGTNRMRSVAHPDGAPYSVDWR